MQRKGLSRPFPFFPLLLKTHAYARDRPRMPLDVREPSLNDIFF